jgi:hypothetical protein
VSEDLQAGASVCRQGETARAVADLEQAIRLDPNLEGTICRKRRGFAVPACHWMFEFLG